MENQSIKWVVPLAMIIVLSVTGCYYDINEAYSNFESQYYSIDPATILESLDRGNMDVFTPLDPTPRAMSPVLSESVSWSQVDYLRVTQALYQKYWQDPFDTLNIYSIDLSMNCADAEQSLFSKAELLSYTIINTGKEETRKEYRTFVTPSAHLVFMTTEEFTPNIKKRASINLKQYQVSAEEAVQIAEKNGGTENDRNTGIIARSMHLHPDLLAKVGAFPTQIITMGDGTFSLKLLLIHRMELSMFWIQSREC